MFLKRSLRDRVVCVAVIAGMTQLEVFFLSPLRNCSLKISLPTLFAAVLSFFLPPTTSTISGTAIANQLASTRFAAGTIFLFKNGIAALPITCASALNPRPYCRPKPL